jgi:hypothetical protein
MNRNNFQFEFVILTCYLNSSHNSNCSNKSTDIWERKQRPFIYRSSWALLEDTVEEIVQHNEKAEWTRKNEEEKLMILIGCF